MTPISCDIVIPYHPATLRWVGTAIDSALNQQHADCIVHVIADAVPETDQQTVKHQFADAPNIRFYSNAESIGPYRSLHTIFNHLQTEYIAIQDSDDISLPHRIWHSITSLKEHKCDLFGGAMENFLDWRSGVHANLESYMKEHGTVMHSGVQRDYCPSGRILNPTMVIARQAFEGLNGFADWFCGCDVEFAERAQRAGVSVHFSRTVVVLRRLYGDSLSHGSTLGRDSRKRQQIQSQTKSRFAQFEGQFDPAAFGSLHLYTERLSNVS